MIKSKTQLKTDIDADAEFTTGQKDILKDAVDSYQNVFPQVRTTQRDALTPTTGLTVYNTETARHEYWNGAQWLGVGTGVSSCAIKKVVVTPAEMLNLATAPVTLLPAPGAGYVALPIAAIMRLTYVSEAYNFAPETVLVAFNSHKEDYEYRLQGVPVESLNHTATCTFGSGDGAAGDVDGMVENDAVVLFAHAGGATTGNGGLTIWLLYSIIPF